MRHDLLLQRVPRRYRILVGLANSIAIVSYYFLYATAALVLSIISVLLFVGFTINPWVIAVPIALCFVTYCVFSYGSAVVRPFLALKLVCRRAFLRGRRKLRDRVRQIKPRTYFLSGAVTTVAAFVALLAIINWRAPETKQPTRETNVDVLQRISEGHGSFTPQNEPLRNVPPTNKPPTSEPPEIKPAPPPPDPLVIPPESKQKTIPASPTKAATKSKPVGKPGQKQLLPTQTADSSSQKSQGLPAPTQSDSGSSVLDHLRNARRSDSYGFGPFTSLACAFHAPFIAIMPEATEECLRRALSIAAGPGSPMNILPPATRPAAQL
jgi:hypothetical protein